jgi:predicted GNAT superfamily acetyltransferase
VTPPSAWREAVADVLTECFARGLRAIDFDADLEGGRPAYLLGDAKAVPTKTLRA